MNSVEDAYNKYSISVQHNSQHEGRWGEGVAFPSTQIYKDPMLCDRLKINTCIRLDCFDKLCCYHAQCSIYPFRFPRTHLHLRSLSHVHTMGVCSLHTTQLLAVVTFLLYTSALCWVEVQKECAKGCENRGNCNRETGECECPFGFVGPACEKLIYPACRSADTPDALPWYGYITPKSCECYRQLEAPVEGRHSYPIVAVCRVPPLPLHLTPSC